jgi:hypothetical protein
MKISLQAILKYANNTVRYNSNKLIQTPMNPFAYFIEQGVPDNLSKLFSASRKSEAVKLCHEIVLSDFDITRMIINCGLCGYQHPPIFHENDVDYIFDSLARTGITPSNLSSTYRQLEKDSATTIFHFFILTEKPEIWHLLYWDSREDWYPGQFKFGTHVHFINHLWGDITIQDVMRRIPERPKCGAHIRTHRETSEANKTRDTTRDNVL